ncbi:MAG: hypothetical protein JNL21_20080 [Myxococcales bacterium]|nr:hypothetical protein [Myxococcales bacterium]
MKSVGLRQTTPGAAKGGRPPRPHGIELSAKTIRHETADRVDAIPCGGIGAIHQLAHRVGLVRALDTRLPILMVRRPYSEADHILTIAYNLICGGHVLDDISRYPSRAHAFPNVRRANARAKATSSSSLATR